jgi:membrane glycosyltransferase
MEKRPKETNDARRRMSKAFKVMIVVTFFLFVIAIFLLTWYARILLGISFSIFLIIARLVVGYVARKEGYVEKAKERMHAKELSPKYYYYARRVKVIVGGGLLTGFAILTTLRVLYGPLPYLQFLLLFLALIVVGANVGDIIGRKL